MRPTRLWPAFVALLLLAATTMLFAGSPLRILFPELPARSLYCAGDHAVCGCDPELVAAGACCCFKSASLKPEPASCCPPHTPPANQYAGPEARPAKGKLIGPWLSLPSCGGGSKYLSLLALKLDCSLVEAAKLPRPGASGTVPTAIVADWRSRAEKPPVPPPRAA